MPYCDICGTIYDGNSQCMNCYDYYAQACQCQEIVPGLKRKNTFTKTTWEIAQRLSSEGATLKEIEAKIDQREAEIAKRLEFSERQRQEAMRKNEEFRKRNGYK